MRWVLMDKKADILRGKNPDKLNPIDGYYNSVIRLDLEKNWNNSQAQSKFFKHYCKLLSVLIYKTSCHYLIYTLKHRQIKNLI